MTRHITSRAASLALGGVAFFLPVRPAAQSRAPARLAAATPSPILAAMKQELGRNFQTLRAQPTPAYYISYEVTEARSVNIRSSFGALASSYTSRRRQLDMNVRVGDYRFDNTHTGRFRFARPDFIGAFAGSVDIPIEDDPLAIRQALWAQTDRQYKRAVEQLLAARTNAQDSARTRR
jgi:hypothetical protein